MLRPVQSVAPCPMLHTLLVPFFIGGWRRPHELQTQLEQWWDPLIEALAQRRAQGNPVHTLRIVGVWNIREEHAHLEQQLDARMTAQVASIVDGIVDERMPLSDLGYVRSMMDDEPSDEFVGGDW